MRLRLTLAAASIIGLPVMAAAQPITGLYIGAGALWNYKQDEHLQSPALGLQRSAFRFNAGGVGGVGSVGWGFGNGLRVELEGDYRQSPLDSRGPTRQPFASGGSTQQDYGAMANVLYDVDLRRYGVSFVTPYVGLGAGYQWSHLNGYDSVNAVNGNVLHMGGTAGNFAYQGIVGAAFPIHAVPGLALTAEYRFLGVLGSQRFRGESFGGAGAPGAAGNVDISENLNHSVLVGFRYAFNTVSAPPPPAPVSPVPAVTPARTYLVFFDWDRADLSDRARQIIGEAAQASTRVQTTRIEVQGNTDTSGTPAYNQRLSLRRAQTVAAELVRDGVQSSAIDIQAFGDTRPLVATGPGVREPQNRRVAIILR